MYIPASKTIVRRIAQMTETTTSIAEDVECAVKERGARWTFLDRVYGLKSLRRSLVE